MEEQEYSGDDIQWSSRVLDKETGFSFLVVWKAPQVPLSIDAMAALVASMKEAIETMSGAGLVPLTNSFHGQDVISVPLEERGSFSRNQAPPQAPSKPVTSHPPSEPSAPAQTTLDDGQRVVTSNHEAVGIGDVTKIVVEEKDGKPGQLRVAFHLANRQRPIYDNRGPEVAATVFRPDCFTDSFTKDTLCEEGVYKPDLFGHLVAVSGKSKGRGFWDVIAIKRG